MEEVWKDISLSSLHHPSTTAAAHHGVILQDFLSLQDPPPTMVNSCEQRSSARCGAGHAPPPATTVSISSSASRSEFRFLESSDQARSAPRESPSQAINDPSFVSNNSFNLTSPFEAALAFPPPITSCKKRASENEDNSGDIQRRHRLMKNRESADRSRSRKQAYTNALEKDVARLMNENANLKRQLAEKFPSAELPKKHILHRTSTAPF